MKLHTDSVEVNDSNLDISFFPRNLKRKPSNIGAPLQLNLFNWADEQDGLIVNDPQRFGHTRHVALKV